MIGIEIVKLRYSSDSPYHTPCLLPTCRESLDVKCACDLVAGKSIS